MELVVPGHKSGRRVTERRDLCHEEMEEDWAEEAMGGGAGPGGFATTSQPRTTDPVN